MPAGPATNSSMRGPVLDDGDYTLFKGEDDLLLLADDVSLHIQPSGRVADLATLNGAEIRAAGTAGMLALEAAIDSFGQASVHAAGLTLPGTDDLVLLYAASGTGKTTTALNLARAGFGLCSDDAMVLAPTEAGDVGVGNTALSQASMPTPRACCRGWPLRSPGSGTARTSRKCRSTRWPRSSGSRMRARAPWSVCSCSRAPTSRAASPA